MPPSPSLNAPLLWHTIPTNVMLGMYILFTSWPCSYFAAQEKEQLAASLAAVKHAKDSVSVYTYHHC